METETNAVAPCSGIETCAAVVTLDTESFFRAAEGGTYEQGRAHLSGDVLRKLVQLAYDEYGILAEPSLEREAERAPQGCPCGMALCSDNAVHVAHNTGVRA